MQEACQWLPEVAEACQLELVVVPVVVLAEALVAKDSQVPEEDGLI